MPNNWKVADYYSDDPRKQILHNRGIVSESEIEEFFNPSIDRYRKDLAIDGINKANDRIKQAIAQGQKIVIYGDYDADGICATSLMYHALASLNAKVLPYIPHREKEGYGLSIEGLASAKKQGAQLVITVDNGIVALKEADYAKSIGLDLIITDHHTNLETLPDCLAVVHSIAICGAAVAWAQVKEIISPDLSQELLDLVAIATVCDMMPLLGINRALVYEGLKQLNKTSRAGLLALFSLSKLERGSIDAYQIGHVIGPRLNAIGRLDHALDAVRLLCTKDVQKSFKLATLLVEANDSKKLLAQQAVLEAKVMVETQLRSGINNKIIVVHSEKWIPGIIGLVATRITEEYQKPTIAISEVNGIAKASARSIAGLDIVKLIRECSEYLIEVGGHPQAAGFTMQVANIEIFKDKINSLLQSSVIEHRALLDIDMELQKKILTKELVDKLLVLEPTGQANPKPTFVCKNMVVSDVKTLSAGKHLKLTVDGIDAIAFSFGNLEKLIQKGTLLDLAFFLEINRFNRNEKVQLKVVDIKIL